jgi:aspartate/tyrosine/aromatic aminotransferase
MVNGFDNLCLNKLPNSATVDATKAIHFIMRRLKDLYMWLSNQALQDHDNIFGAHNLDVHFYPWYATIQHSTIMRART